MANKNLWLKPFDPSLKYMVVKPMKVGGKKLVYGDPVPVNAFTTRQLRQFYDARKIGPMAADAKVSNADQSAPEDGGYKYAIEKAGPWSYVTKDGVRISKAVRLPDAKKMLEDINAASWEYM